MFKKMVISICVMMLVGIGTSPARAQEHDYIVENGEAIPIPVAYNLYDTYDVFSGYGVLNNPQDMFIGQDGYIYIADTGNNRILKIDGSGHALGEFKAENAGGLSSPEGIFVNRNGDLFIADTENMRILHLSANGNLIGEYKKPRSGILGKDFGFLPKKVSVSTTGMLYILCKTEAQGLLSIDEDGDFRGYAGTEKVGFDWLDFLIRIFGSAQQKKMIAKRLPTPVSNFLVLNDDIYAVLGNAKSNQIAIYNSIGKNLYPSGNFGQDGFLNDLAVSGDGIVTVLDSNSCRVFQYDKNGNNLAIFGDKGDRKGEFAQPVSISADGEGNLLVLDAGKCNIRVFKPTYFISLVHSATDYYNSGEYLKAMTEWENVLRIDESYTLAHKGIAEALFKQGSWRDAMVRFKYIDDKSGYSKAYSEYLHDFYRTHFGIIVLVSICMLVLFYKVVGKLKKFADRYH